MSRPKLNTAAHMNEMLARRKRQLARAGGGQFMAVYRTSKARGFRKALMPGSTFIKMDNGLMLHPTNGWRLESEYDRATR